MENIHHSLPKRSNGGYTSSHKSGVYDGVFAAAPAKFGLTALAPRHEDYVEIFGGFHAARSSSIPVLDVPAIDGDELELDFDVKSSGFDYKEVFGECRGFDWTASFEDVVAQSSGGYDSSDEAWSPSQSGSLSDELDPLAGSDKSSRLSNGDAQQSLESNMQFNVCYNKSSQRVTETVLAGTTHVTKFGPVPVHTSSQYETSVPSNEHCPLHVTEDINPDKKFDGRDPVEEYSKCSSNPLYSGFSKSGNDSNTSETHVGTSSSLDRPFMTISDISLRTKPSRLPPPSRAPPALAAKRAECDGSISKHKPLKSYSLDGVAEGSSPPFFDVEEDADLSADSSTHGNKNMHAKHICSDESIDRKEVRSHAKGHLGDFKKVEDRRNKIVGACSSFQAGDGLQLHGEETLESVPSFEDRIASRKSADKFSDSQGGQYCDHISEKTAGDVFGRVETEYFEVVGKDIYIEPFQTMENYNSLMQHMNPEANRHLRATDFQVSNQNESVKKFKVTKEVPRWDEKRLDIKRDGDDCDGANQQQMRKLNTRLGDETVKVNLNKLTCVHDLDRMMPSGAQQPVESGIQQIDQRGSVKGQVETKNVNGVETKAKPHASSKTVEIEKKFVHAQKMEENRGKHEENIVREEGQRILEDAEQAESIEKIHGKIEHEGIMKRENRACGKENENEIMKSRVLKENEMIPEETNIHESVKKSCISDGHGRKGGEQNPLEVDKDKELLMEAGKPKVNEVAFTRAFQHSENYTEQELAPEKKLTKERKEDAFTKEDNDLRFEKAEAKLGNKGGYFEIEANEHLSRYTVQELGGQAEDGEPVESNRHGDEVNWDLESDVIVEGDLLKVLDGACELDKGTATRVDKKHANLHKLETAEEAFSCKENMELKTRPNITDNESGAGTDDPVIKVKFSKFSENNDEFQVGNSGSMKDAVESTSLPKQMRNPNVGGTGAGSTRVVTDKAAPAMVRNHKTQKIISNEDDRELKMKGTQVVIEKVDIRDSLPTCPAIREPVVNGRKVEDASLVFEHNQDLMYSTRNATKQSNGRNDKNTKYNLAAKDPKVGERIRRETDLENERIRKLEEEREREREREKDRMAVDKAALEARERSYAEARERAAVERATAEVRQRAMAEARERLEKTSMEARSRAERASVERATAEARQRAVEKSMAEKAAFDARDRVEKSVSDRFSVFHRSVDTRQSSLSSDLHFQSTGMSNGLRHSYFSANAGAEGESPQRSKARLERYRRTAERAANALAEKNMRDLLAQKEREERNRVAEVLDAEVKRWSSGKEGNLRALLSTLQYILGPDSGWHPVPLTDVITSAAVKKAYRKATLCVHPDKLQQRGATIQQKYICEKVFDLLKEAWNKFNSEER